MGIWETACHIILVLKKYFFLTLLRLLFQRNLPLNLYFVYLLLYSFLPKRRYFWPGSICHPILEGAGEGSGCSAGGEEIGEQNRAALAYFDLDFDFKHLSFT